MPELICRADPDLRSFVVTWRNAKGDTLTNQVYEHSRDEAIWRLALLMQAAHPKHIRFVSCHEEVPGHA